MKKKTENLNYFCSKSSNSFDLKYILNIFFFCIGDTGINKASISKMNHFTNELSSSFCFVILKLDIRSGNDSFRNFINA